MIKGLVLAAGEGKRMGEVKQLMKINGYPLVVWAIMNLRHAGVEEICVVLGKDADHIAEVLEPWEVKVVRNENYSSSDMFTSIKLGLQEIKDASAVVVLPADNPLIKVETLMSLLHSFEQSDASVIYPMYQEQQGHPPIIRSAVFEDILTSKEDGGLRKVLERHDTKAVRIIVDDRGTVMDADTKEDFEALEAHGKNNFGVALSVCDDMASELGFYEEDRDQALLEAVEAMELGKEKIMAGEGCDLIMEMNIAYIRYLIQDDKGVEKEWVGLLEKSGYYRLKKQVNSIVN